MKDSSFLYLFTNLTSATTGFFNTQITRANVNNTGSMDQALPSIFITGYVASSLSIPVFVVVHSALVTSLRLCASSTYEQNLSTCRTTSPLFSQFVDSPESPPILNRKKLKIAPPAHSRSESGSSSAFEPLARCGEPGGSISPRNT
jgi:hypothetical protein